MLFQPPKVHSKQTLETNWWVNLISAENVILHDLFSINTMQDVPGSCPLQNITKNKWIKSIVFCLEGDVKINRLPFEIQVMLAQPFPPKKKGASKYNAKPANDKRCFVLLSDQPSRRLETEIFQGLAWCLVAPQNQQLHRNDSTPKHPSWSWNWQYWKLQLSHYRFQWCPCGNVFERYAQLMLNWKRN